MANTSKDCRFVSCDVDSYTSLVIWFSSRCSTNDSDPLDFRIEIDAYSFWNGHFCCA